MNTWLEELGSSVSNEMIAFFLGKKLGSGQFRDVYELASDTTKVVKVDSRGTASFSNVMEWEIWRDCPNEWAKWLAPCYSISFSGNVLIQARIEPLRAFPKRVPSFLTDIKRANWGLYKGRPVCCDYGYHRFFTGGFERAKLVKAKPHA